MMNKKLGRTMSRSELRGVKGGEETCGSWCADGNNCSCEACRDECRDACDYEYGPDTCGTDCCINSIDGCCI